MGKYIPIRYNQIKTTYYYTRTREHERYFSVEASFKWIFSQNRSVWVKYQRRKRCDIEFFSCFFRSNAFSGIIQKKIFAHIRTYTMCWCCSLNKCISKGWHLLLFKISIYFKENTIFGSSHILTNGKWSVLCVLQCVLRWNCCWWCCYRTATWKCFQRRAKNNSITYTKAIKEIEEKRRKKSGKIVFLFRCRKRIKKKYV